MLSTIFYRISAVATNLRKNVEEAFTPPPSIASSTEPVFSINTTTASPTLETTPVECETVLPTVSTNSPKFMREQSFVAADDKCSGDCTNCKCEKLPVPDVEECSIKRVCSKSACGCLTQCDLSDNCIDISGNSCDLSGNCF